jgi:Leucine-rich repeat (LRR) protein
MNTPIQLVINKIDARPPAFPKAWYSNLLVSLCILLLCSPVKAQNARTFTSVEEALKTPQLVEILDLTDQNLTALPPQIGMLQNLKELLAGGNHLQTLPDEFCRLKKLRILYLPNNKISRLPELIGNLRSLREINLLNNELETLPISFGKLDSLISLELFGNNLLAFPKELCSCLQLNELGLYFNALSDIPNCIGELQ